MLTPKEIQEDDDLLNTYLMLFGTETLRSANTQEGEVAFLTSVPVRGPHGETAWTRIQTALVRRGGR